jgi:hypothetical protein
MIDVIKGGKIVLAEIVTKPHVQSLVRVHVVKRKLAFRQISRHGR